MDAKTLLKQQVISFLTEGQVTDSDYYTRSKEYEGYYLNDDDSPLYTYAQISEGVQRPIGVLKTLMIEMRNDGLVELVPAVDLDEYRPSGSGWSLTEKGLIYAVDNDLVTI